jgi:hypothetical protein
MRKDRSKTITSLVAALALALLASSCGASSDAPIMPKTPMVSVEHYYGVVASLSTAREKPDPVSAASYYLRKADVVELLRKTVGADGQGWYLVTKMGARQEAWVQSSALANQNPFDSMEKASEATRHLAP